MRKAPVNQAKDTDSSERRSAEFEAALKAVAARVGATEVNVVGTPISAFTTRYATILNRIRAGSIEVITQRGEPFVILGRHQVLALLGNGNAKRSVQEILAGLPSVPASVPRPIYTSVLTKSHYRVPR